MDKRGLLLPVVLLAVSCQPALGPGAGGLSRPARAPETLQPLDLAGARRELVVRFDRLLDEPERYEAAVRRTRQQFPEGDLFSYTFPAIAYAQLVAAGELEPGQALARMAQLIDRAVESTTNVVRPPEGRLEALTSYRGHGCYLGQLNLALAWWSMIGGDDRYLALHRRLTTVLAEALEEREGAPLDSYPGSSWTIDTVPALASVAAFDRHAGTSLAPPLIEAHRRWVEAEGLHGPTGLPAWQLLGGRPAPPRGCDLSLRIALLSELDRDFADSLYRRYTRQYWLDRGMIAGFAEWPDGGTGLSDFDSGPIFWGVGTTASAFGLAATAAMGDGDRLARLEQQLGPGRDLIEQREGRDPSPLGGMIETDSSYLTGFLYGDAILFWAVTWHPWPS